MVCIPFESRVRSWYDGSTGARVRECNLPYPLEIVAPQGLGVLVAIGLLVFPDR